MSVYEFGPFQVDVERLLLLHDGEPVALGPKVVETLLALIEHPGAVLSKSTLLDRIWPEGFVEEANLAQNIYVLRKTLRAQWDTDAIETVPRRGYRFTAPVRSVEPALPAEPQAVTVPRATAVRVRSPWNVYAAAALVLVMLTAVSFGLIAARGRTVHAPLSDNGARIYAIGRYYWNLRTREGVQKSLTYFAHVIDSDPNNPLGYAALAQANATMGDYEFGTQKPAVYYARAHAYAEKSLALDKNSGEAHAALGLIALNQSKLNIALDELRTALALNPNDGAAHEWYGIALLTRGDLRAAVKHLQRSAELDPLSVATTSWLGDAAYLDRRYDEAIVYSRQALDLSPRRYDALATLGLTYEARGDYPHAIEAFQQFARGAGHGRARAAAYLAHTYALEHRTADAKRELAYAMAHAKDIDPIDLAIAIAASGSRRVALNVLRHAHEDRIWIAIANDPRYDALREDAQFKQLAQGPA